MASQPTSIRVPAFAGPSFGQIKPTMLPKNACQEHTSYNVVAPAPYVEVRGAELMAAPAMGGGAPAEDSAPTEFQRDEAEGGGEDFVRLSHGVSYIFSTPPRLFLPRAPHLQTASSRDIVYMQAGQCGKQMGTKF
jgi:hypothetical protein